MKLKSLFPVQKQVIPLILNSNLSQSIYPNDICVTAPTGSGKTLAYVLPIIQNLKNRIKPCCRAVILLPVSDLAEQVYNVFKSQLSVNNQKVLNENFSLASTLTDKHDNDDEPIDLKVMLLSTKHSFSKEQSLIVNSHSGKCEIDILITTPGRLVDHLLKTRGFSLKELRYLVLDECDRIMDQIKHNWLQILNNSVFGEQVSNLNENRKLLTNEALSVYNLILDKSRLYPYQKILLSATLTRDPEKFEQMKLFHPIFFNIGSDNFSKTTPHKQHPLIAMEVSEEEKKLPANDNNENESDERKISSISVKKNNNVVANLESNLSLPNELTEIFIQVLSLQKPLMVIYLIKKLGYRRMLCFVKSKENAKRLTKLLELNGIVSAEYSASQHATKRKQIQTRFENNEIDVLVCSDVMARGMDLANVDYVLLYDSPHHISSYVHKVGRTARAGKSGTAITFLEHKEIFHFKKMMASLNSSESKLLKTDTTTTTTQKAMRKVREIKIQKSKLKSLVEDYEISLSKLKSLLKSK